jgi:hypothetical protein
VSALCADPFKSQARRYNSFPDFFWMDDGVGVRASRVQVRALRPNHWWNHSVWKTGFRRDAENGNRDGRAPHSE